MSSGAQASECSPTEVRCVDDTAGSEQEYSTIQACLDAAQAVDVQVWDGASYVSVGNIGSSVGVSSSSVSFGDVNVSGIRLWQEAGMGFVNYSNIMWIAEIDYSLEAAGASACGAADDGPRDGTVSTEELAAYVDLWIGESVSIDELLVAINEWKSGC